MSTILNFIKEENNITPVEYVLKSHMSPYEYYEFEKDLDNFGKMYEKKRSYGKVKKSYKKYILNTINMFKK
jgi:hypothetical protein